MVLAIHGMVVMMVTCEGLLISTSSMLVFVTRKRVCNKNQTAGLESRWLRQGDQAVQRTDDHHLSRSLRLLFLFPPPRRLPRCFLSTRSSSGGSHFLPLGCAIHVIIRQAGARHGETMAPCTDWQRRLVGCKLCFGWVESSHVPKKKLENEHVIRCEPGPFEPWMFAHTHPITVRVEGTAPVRSGRITGPIRR
jgi:hypothetical protein